MSTLEPPGWLRVAVTKSSRPLTGVATAPVAERALLLLGRTTEWWDDHSVSDAKAAADAMPLVELRLGNSSRLVAAGRTSRVMPPALESRSGRRHV